MKGPKTMLAEAIAGALDAFFVIDQESMETTLLSDAAVKLHNTELKPRHDVAIGTTNTTCSVRGVVKYVAFEWHWGKSQKDGGSDLVKDVTLTLQGLEFTVSLETKENADSNDLEGAAVNASAEDTQQEPAKPTTGFMFYVQEQIERIMDTLTLTVNDVVLTVELPDGSKLVMGGNGVEISSLGRQEGLPLLQELDIQRLHSNVISRDGVSYPLLEDISYKAKTERKFGSRFLSSIDRGVEVMGESNDNGIVVHAGETQIQVISSLLGLLAQASMPSPPSLFEGGEGVEVPIEGLQHSGGVSYTIEKEEPEGLPSYIQLPLAGVSLILPNEAKMALSNIVFKYQMDGTIFSIEGKQGITVDDHPFFALGETSIWISDLVKSEFRVEDTAVSDEAAQDEVAAYFRANSAELTKLSGGFMEALGIHQRAYKVQEKDRPQASSATPEPAPQTDSKQSNSSSWTLHLPGMIGCLWEQEGSDIEFTLCNVEAELASMSMNVARVDKFHYPGTFQLAEPVEYTTLAYVGSAISAILQDIVVVLAGKEETDTSADSGANREIDRESSSKDSTESSEGSAGFTLPFGVHLTVSKFLAFKSDAKSVHTTIEKLELKMDPVTSESNQNDDRTCVAVRVSELNHDMLRLQEPVFQSTFVMFSDWDPISSFRFGAKAIYVATGYSLLDWKALLPKKKVEQIEKKPLKLPYAHVDKLKVIAMVKGVIGVSDTVLQVDPFDGSETTTSDDMISFYGKKVTSQVPGMIANAEVMGTSVGDNVGGAIIGNLVGGAGLGGLLSVAAFDGVRNTIKEGKVSRGVEETDEWQFSDIARGLQHAAVRATREGAEKRGKGQVDTGDPIDWAVGASADATKYAGENKARLAGAGAGAMGFGYGLALGGPVGAVVGTLIASAATQKTVEAIDDATKKKGIGGGAFTVHDVSPDPRKQQKSNEILFSGILLKRRDLVQWDWHSHYFVLTRSSLKYYVMSSKPPRGHKGGKNDLFFDSSKGPRKSLDFVNHYIGKDNTRSRPESNLFVFSIFSLESAAPLWTLAASSEESRDDWLSAVSEAMSSDWGNDVRRSRVSLRSSTNKIDDSRRESVRQSLPPELRDMLDF